MHANTLQLSVMDVGNYCAEALLKPAKPGQSSVKLFGPRLYSPLDVKQSVEAIAGKEARLATVDKEHLASWFAKHVPQTYAQEFADMVTAILPGGIMSRDFEYDETTVKCKTELADSLRRLVSQ